MEEDCRRCRYGNTFINTSCQQGEGRKEESGEPQDMKIKQEAAANRICLLAKKCSAFQFQFRPLNSFAYLRAAKQEQCAPSPRVPSSLRLPLSPAPSLGTKFTQCKYAEPHARTHENTRTLTYIANAHRHSHWQLSFPFASSSSSFSLCRHRQPASYSSALLHIV